MTVKANKQLKSFAAMLSLGGTLVAVAGLIYLFFTPKIYEASVKIRLRNWIRADAPKDSRSSYDLAAECQAARADAVLDRAIKNLGLNELWSKRFNQGIPLKSGQSRILLKAKTSARPIPKSSLIQIQASSEDRNEAAAIANEIARLYQAEHQAQRQALNVERLAQFREKWEEQGQKVQQAQAALDQLYLDITRNRTTNPAAFHDLILARRIDWEGQYVAQRDQLARLKAMTQEQLQQVLPTLETNTNSLLTATLIQRSQARTDLVLAQSTYAADSPELKHAALAVDELDKTIAGMVAGIMTAREKEVVSLKAAFDQANEQLKLAGTNQKEITDQNLAYAQARQNLEDLKLERDILQQKMDQEESHYTLMPAQVVPEIIDSADPPQKPATPDGKIAASTIAAGFLAASAGLVLLLAGQKPKSAPRKP